MNNSKYCGICKRTYPAWEPRCYVCAMTGRKVAAIALALFLIAAPAHAAEKCIATYVPSGPIVKNDPPCQDWRDMGYLDNSENPFTEFHFLHSVPQNKRDYYARHIRLSLPWRIANPKASDDK